MALARSAPIGAAQFGLIICVVFLAVFGLVVLVGERRHKARERRAERGHLPGG